MDRARVSPGRRRVPRAVAVGLGAPAALLAATALVALLAGAPAQDATGDLSPAARTGTAAPPFLDGAPDRPVGLAAHGLECADLPAYRGEREVPAGTTLTRVRFPTPLDLSAGGITIEQSCFQPVAVGRGLPVASTTEPGSGRVTPSRVVIADSEFDGSLLGREDAAWSTAFIGVADLLGNDVHGFGSGLAIMGAGTRLDALVEGNHVHDLVAWGDPATTGNHSSALTVRDFSAEERPDRRLVVRANRLDSSSGSDTGALFIQAWSGRVDNVLVTGNLLEGQGYQLGLEEAAFPYSGIEVVGNRATGTGWGAAYVTGGPGPARWSDNHLYDPRAPEGRGDTIPRP